MRTIVESGSGLALDLLQPQPSQVVLTDIVHALAMQPRLLGAVSQRYSIAQHLLLVYDLLHALAQPKWQKTFVLYFISKSHVPFVGDIPPALREQLALQSNLAKQLTRIHICVAQHLQSVYGLESGTLQVTRAPPLDLLTISTLEVITAYETYHLMQGGGWSLRPDDISRKVEAVVKVAWNASKYRFGFDTPPRVLAENAVQSDLLKRLTAVCTFLRKEAA